MISEFTSDPIMPRFFIAGLHKTCASSRLRIHNAGTFLPGTMRGPCGAEEEFKLAEFGREIHMESVFDFLTHSGRPFIKIPLNAPFPIDDILSVGYSYQLHIICIIY